MKQIYQYIVANILTTGAIMAFLYFIMTEVIKSKVQSSIKIEYDKMMEDYKYSQLQRQKAALVAELIAEWLSQPDDRKRLNQLTLEAFIWLPKDTANKLSNLLAHKPGSGSVRDVLAEVRVIILGQKEKIDPNDIIIFPANKDLQTD